MASQLEIVNRPGDLSESSASWASRITRLPAPERLVAIGDVHGDFNKTRVALMIAKVMNDQDEWIGGNAVVVQMGDILDRGPQELEILILLEKLQGQALAQGGQIIIMLGNHEVMNMEERFMYVHQAALLEFENYKTERVLSGLDKEEDYHLSEKSSVFQRDYFTRAAAMRPGGPVTKRFFANSPAVLQVGSSVFVHGGIKPCHADHGLERMNAEAREWVLGHCPDRRRSLANPPDFLSVAPHYNGIVWERDYVTPSTWDDFSGELKYVLDTVGNGAKRMVVGHTNMDDGKITFFYDYRVVAIDVGMSYDVDNNVPEVLEILNGDTLSVLTKHGRVDPSQRSVQSYHRK